MPERRDDPTAIAHALHGAAIRLLRRLRIEDREAGLSGPRLSALSVVVFGGPITVGALAEAEQVRPPTMTRLVQALEAEGLVRRARDRADRRVVRVYATDRGRQVLEAGRARRVAVLSAELARLPVDDRATLARAAALLEELTARSRREDGRHRSGRS